MMETNPIFNVAEIKEEYDLSKVNEKINNGWILLNTYIHYYQMDNDLIGSEPKYIIGKLK
jgi:hypothetical protein